MGRVQHDRPTSAPGNAARDPSERGGYEESCRRKDDKAAKKR